MQLPIFLGVIIIFFKFEELKKQKTARTGGLSLHSIKSC